jgi:hypothetical protein
MTLSTAPRSGLKTAAEGTKKFKRGITTHLDGIARRRQCMGRERGLLKKRAIDRRPTATHCHRSVCPHTEGFELATALAIGPSVRTAMLAFAAPWKRDHDVIAHR